MLDKYELRRAIGRGAAGIVYDAWDTMLKRRVAIKVVRLDDKDEMKIEDFRARFRQEAQVASKLSHPGVVGVHNYGETDDSAFIDMEFVEGDTLKTLLDQGQRLGTRRTVGIICDVLAALDYCHGHQVVHRDIKPANIMLPAGGGVKLADFGIARIENSELTLIGTVMGTPPYMSPEQFAGDPAVDLKTDLWSVGVVLYEMLTGERPFSGPDLGTIRQRITGAPFEAPSRRAADLPPALDRVLDRALRKAPKDRFPSAGAFAEALRAALPAEAGGAVGKTGGGVARKGRAGLMAGGIAAAAVLVAGAGVWAWLGDGSDPGKPPAVAAKPPRDPASASGSAPSGGERPRVSERADPSASDRTPAGSAPPLPPSNGGRIDPAPAPAPPAVEASPASGAPPLAGRLAAIPCSSVRALPGAASGATLFRGVVGSGTPRAALDAIVAGLPPASARTEVQTFPRSPVACQLAELVRANAGETPEGARLATSDGRTSLIKGNEVRLRLRMPEFDGEVRLENLNASGQISHLMEATFGVPPRHHAKGLVGLGEGGGDYIGLVTPPYGADLLIAVVASRPLFAAQRPEEENGAAYADALAAAVARLRGEGGRVAMDALVLTTSER